MRRACRCCAMRSEVVYGAKHPKFLSQLIGSHMLLAADIRWGLCLKPTHHAPPQHARGGPHGRHADSPLIHSLKTIAWSMRNSQSIPLFSARAAAAHVLGAKCCTRCMFVLPHCITQYHTSLINHYNVAYHRITPHRITR